ncbi:hypothetical protein BST99_11335 [Aureicoccus marinus]|uniref:O-antigen ligase-related domain-containing protein n=2 Tax=Aureicoccus marinus TaxID=754435 RepID=A0A2S7T9R4_9FLAO|nr:hypothetical protein BST99_11335 [Aureicoccus marinus]
MGLLVYRIPATIGINLLILLTVLNYKRLHFDKRKWKIIMLLAIPFLLDVLFVWNNDSFQEAVVNGEKHLGTLLIPIAILSFPRAINLRRILKVYSLVFTLLLTFCFLIHFFTSVGDFQGYLQGKMVWRMGYEFALSMGLHGPALNLHIAFLCIINMYIWTQQPLRLKEKAFIHSGILFLLAFILLLFVNTRVAVVCGIAGSLVVLFVELNKKLSVNLSIKAFLIGVLVITVLVFGFVQKFPYLIEKYSQITFHHMDKVGRLDEFKNPEAEVYNSLVTRVSIWKTTYGLGKRKWLVGYGPADARKELITEYERTDQQFLYRNKFPVHNQFLDFFLKFGVIGVLLLLIYFGSGFWLSFQSRHILCLIFVTMFVLANFLEDFLVRFDGIVFNTFWLSLFSLYFLNAKRKDQLKS